MEELINKIHLSDNLELLSKIGDNEIDLVVTSPPYDDIRDYHGFSWDIDKVVNELYRVVKEGGVVAWVVGDRVKNHNKSLTSFRQAIKFQERGFNVYEHLIFEKAGSSPPVNRRYQNNFESIFIFSKGKPKTVNLITDKKNKWAGNTGFGKKGIRNKDGSITPKKRKPVNEFGRRTTIWRYANTYGYSTKDIESHNHPAIFPELLAEDLIKSYSNEEDIVLDIFSGSGTTAKMSLLNNRQYIACELSKEYYELSLNRLNKYLTKEGEETKVT